MGVILFNQNVLEKARERIRMAFDDFDRVLCTFSGGKDSLVTLHLAITEAEKRGRKVHCVFLDQEAEWAATIEEVRRWMSHPTVVPYWGRMPFILENSSAILDDEHHYLLTYDPDKQDEWIHPFDPMTINEFPPEINAKFQKFRGSRNDHGVEIYNGKKYPGFYLALATLVGYAAGGERSVVFGGMRASESLGRRMLFTSKIYKNLCGTYNCTGGVVTDSVGVAMSPIYDWKTSDVWKYIYDNKLPYNELYDKMYQVGVGRQNMRISSVCHEMGLRALSVLPELEPRTWERVIKRMVGPNGLRQAGPAYTCPSQFPSVFTSWRDYRDYLFETLIPEDRKPIMAKVLSRLNFCMGTENEVAAIQVQIRSILICDMAGVYVKRFAGSLRTIKSFESRLHNEESVVAEARAHGAIEEVSDVK